MINTLNIKVHSQPSLYPIQFLWKNQKGVNQEMFGVPREAVAALALEKWSTCTANFKNSKRVSERPKNDKTDKEKSRIAESKELFCIQHGCTTCHSTHHSQDQYRQNECSSKWWIPTHWHRKQKNTMTLKRPLRFWHLRNITNILISMRSAGAGAHTIIA